jgi:hypothetical protein
MRHDHMKEGSGGKGNGLTTGGEKGSGLHSRFDHKSKATNGGTEVRNSQLEDEMRSSTKGGHLSSDTGGDY